MHVERSTARFRLEWRSAARLELDRLINRGELKMDASNFELLQSKIAKAAK